jgi:hypothetical protein
MADAMRREEHFWNVSVLQRVHLVNLVVKEYRYVKFKYVMIFASRVSLRQIFCSFFLEMWWHFVIDGRCNLDICM